MRVLAPPIGLAALLAAGLLGASAPAATSRPPPAGTRLQSFGTCGRLLGYAKQHLLPLLPTAPGATLTAPAMGGEARSAAPATPAFSTTNVQEEGVDEPDLVKSNGSFLYVVRAGGLSVVDVRARRPRLVGTLPLEPNGSPELLLYGDRLLVLSGGGGFAVGVPQGGAFRAMPIGPSRSSLTEVDVSDPSNPRVVRSLVLEADYVSARLVGSVVRIVTASGMPQVLPLAAPANGTPEAAAAALARNRAIVRSSRIRSWLPSYVVRGRRGETLVRRPLVQCRNVRRPASYSGLGLLTVLTVDLRKGLAPIDSDSVLAGGRTVYASREGLYVATQRWLAQPLGAGVPLAQQTTTEIHKFDISDPGATHYRGSGSVPGTLLGQWSLSEYGGVLRVASTTEPSFAVGTGTPPEQSESFVTTLREQAGALVQLGQVGGLGKGERVYAVRFMGDTGYVVTFRQIDPLYTLDLSVPTRPAVLGELKLLGYSAYLHPLGGDLLLGVGQDASAEGRRLGTQLSLFDVSDPRRPVRLQSRGLGSAWSEAESDHRAFLWWAPERLAVLPVQAWAGEPFVGAVGFRVGRGSIDEMGRVTHAGELGVAQTSPGVGIPIRRSLVVGDALYTVSDAGVEASSLPTFADLGFAALPQSVSPVPKPG